MADDGERLVVEALRAGEWKEERSKASDGGIKTWYWLKRDKKVKMRSRKELSAHLVRQEEQKHEDGDGNSLVDQPSDQNIVRSPGDGPMTPSNASIGPDAQLMANMGVLGTEVEAMSDVQELRNQIRLWEAKYKVLLEENKRLLVGGGLTSPPAAGNLVPSDLQLKYDALLRQNNALHAEMEVKKNESERLQRAIEDLTDYKAKLEVQLGEAYAQASEGLEAKLKLQEKDDVAQRAGDFVSEHIKEQNKFLRAQVAELTSLLHKLKEEDYFTARATASAEDGLAALAMSTGDRAKVSVHFNAIVNSPARHVLCGRCRATLSRMITSESFDAMQPFSANIKPHSDAFQQQQLPANYSLWPQHTWPMPDAGASNMHLVDPFHPTMRDAAAHRPAAIRNVTVGSAYQPALVPPPVGNEPSSVAVGAYGGFVVRAKQR
ncbi:hypothetical protein DIPPA_06255 [Diplonema papillatum]|nr:hypothetical protein DIPPA_06255 [Diplonema papillatum]